MLTQEDPKPALLILIDWEGATSQSYQESIKDQVDNAENLSTITWKWDEASSSTDKLLTKENPMPTQSKTAGILMTTFQQPDANGTYVTLPACDSQMTNVSNR